MNRRNEVIARYARVLRTDCGIEPDMALLEKVALGCGPAIYGAGAETVAILDPAERLRVRRNFLVRKLGLPDGPDLMVAIDAACEICAGAGPAPYRAVLYYLLVVQQGREAAYS